jgi:archaellum biogenesis ATPase FlaH
MSNSFLDDLFGGQEGIVYSPILINDNFRQYFFSWPQEQERLERHLKNYNDRDIYLSPALFTARKISRETFKGTKYLWSDFDTGVPALGFIEPTMRIMSSQEGHEHWYWRLNEFITDPVIFADLNRRLAYHYEADTGVWDYARVLRPADTWNHKRNKPVTLINRNEHTYTINDFLHVPIPPTNYRVEIELGTLPARDMILAKYRWTEDAVDLLSKEVKQGKRSDALARLAHECAEIGLSNEEMYVIIEERDRAWGKFLNRNDRQKRLEDFIVKVRGKRAVVAEITQSATEVFRFNDFMNTKINLKWAIEGLLPVSGSMVILGKEGLGKSTFSLRLSMALALGNPLFLEWKINEAQKVLFISLEMQHDELKEFFEDMQVPEETRIYLQERLFIWAIGHAYPFDSPDQQIELLKYIDMHKIDLIIIDSHALAMYGSIKDDDAVKRLYSFLNEDVRKARKCGYIFIHHIRKAGIGEEHKSPTLDESFGSRYITANAQTVATLWQKPGSTKVQLKLIKTRMSIGNKDFEMERTPDRGFKLAGTTVSPLPIDRGKTTPEQVADAKSLGSLFNL